MIIYNQSKTQMLDSYDASAGYLIPTFEKSDKGKNIFIFAPYTQEELRERQLLDLRRKREECFSIVNRGVLWYETLSEAQKNELRAWYQKWLDVTETLIEPQPPEWLK